MSKKKIAILGAGPAGLAAAWELTRRDDWQDDYEVTVYQPGWRAGGKCATGRGAANRIEEHGIHVFLGSYNSVFTVVQDVYGARERYGVALESPFPTWEDAFQRVDATILSDTADPTLVRWSAWPILFPENESLPGPYPPTPLLEVLKDVLGAGLTAILGSPWATTTGPISRWILSWFFPQESSFSRLAVGLADLVPLGSRRSRILEEALARQASGTHAGAKATVKALVDDLGHPIEGVTKGLDAILELIEHLLQVGERFAAHTGDTLARDLALLELGLAALRGLFADVWDGDGWDFSRIDDVDLRDWLRKHGASEACVYSSPVRFLYAGTFANVSDTDGRGGSFAAGVAMRAVFEMLAYRGSLVWQMKAGTGDTLVAPLFQVLQARGVKFEFFNEVKTVHDNPDGTIERITVAVQARVADGPYRPLVQVPVEGGVIDAWPDRPQWDQLHPDDAAAIQKAGWAGDCARIRGRTRTLRRGKDFDDVILAIPVGVLPQICPDIIARLPAWQTTVEKVQTVSTQAFQLWFGPTNTELGLPVDTWGVQNPDDAPNIETYANMFTAWDDSTLTIPYEGWPADNRPGAVTYVCGAYVDDGPIAADDAAALDLETARVQGRAQQWCVDNMGWLYRKATTREQPYGLDYNKLAVPPGLPDAKPIQRWQAQYFRANCTPTERYTLSLPGSIESRLWYDDTGFENLLVAGDWAGHDGLNAGFVDGAMWCGIEAGHALRVRLGLPVDRLDLLPPDLVTRAKRRARG